MTALLVDSAKIRILKYWVTVAKMVAVNILLLYEVFILSLRVLEWINLVTWSVNSFKLATIFGIVCCDTFVQQTLSDGLIRLNY